jgi:hypothetical protein
MPSFQAVKIEPCEDKGIMAEAHRLAFDLKELAGIEEKQGDAIALALEIQNDLPPEGYRLSLKKRGITICGADSAGLFYGGQTLLQVLLLGRELRELEIVDWPHYKVREIMLDLGRATYSLPMLKRIVRIMGRLKLNSLHLHLYDDHLNSLRFRNLPLGHENPWALSIEELGELISYARRYHIKVVPELEAWGHAGSIIYHYPELYGAPGMWEGSSFGIGEELYELLAKMFSEVIPVLEQESTVHLGLDEAKWATLPSVGEEDKEQYTPSLHCLRLYNLLEELGKQYGHKLKMRIWADHGGRPLPREIENQVIVEPWQYWECQEEDIKKKVAQYGKAGKPFIMGAGMSSQHLQGSYGATRIWCQEGKSFANALGVNICLWESNLFPEQLVGVYAGADYAWGYSSKLPAKEDEYRERLHGQIMEQLFGWQLKFPEANQDAMSPDRGPLVRRGYYLTGPLARKPVAPTAEHVANRKEDTLLY